MSTSRVQVSYSLSSLNHLDTIAKYIINRKKKVILICMWLAKNTISLFLGHHNLFIAPGFSSVGEYSVIVSFEYYIIVLPWLIDSLPSIYFCWLVTMLDPALGYRSERWVGYDPAFTHQRQIYKQMIANICVSWQKSGGHSGNQLKERSIFLGTPR